MGDSLSFLGSSINSLYNRSDKDYILLIKITLKKIILIKNLYGWPDLI